MSALRSLRRVEGSGKPNQELVRLSFENGLQTAASVLPVKWMAQGMREVFLPAEYAVLEQGGEWNLGGVAVALGVDPNPVTVLPRDRSVDGTEIASVQSPPLMQRLRDMMNFSDNVMAESIGREVAVALKRPASFDGAARSVLATLDDAGLDTSGARLFDSSGLSVDDRLTALTG